MMMTMMTMKMTKAMMMAMMLEWAVFSSSVMEIALPLRLAHQSLTWKKNIRSSDHH